MEKMKMQQQKEVKDRGKLPSSKPSSPPLPPSPNDLVIIGGGIAGVTAAKIFSIDNPQRKVILISASACVKTIANLKILGRSIDIFDVIERNAKDLECPNLQVIIQKVVQLDAARHKVLLDDGTWVTYKKLLICTGAVPRKLRVNDPKAEKFIAVLRDTPDALKFDSLIGQSRRIFLGGNGGISTEVCYAVDNVEIVWAVREDYFGAGNFDAGASKFFSDYLTQYGHRDIGVSKRLRFGELDEPKVPIKEYGAALGPDWSRHLNMRGRTKKQVTIVVRVEIFKVYSSYDSIPEDKRKNLKHCNQECYDWNLYVELTNGEIYGTDLMVIAFGVIPNVEIFATEKNKIRLSLDRGILIDREMRSSIKDIYAAGDVCTPGWQLAKHWFQQRLWTHARQMGFYAAKCIQAHFDDGDPSFYFNFYVFAHITRFFGFRVTMLGLYDGQKLDLKECKILYRIKKGKEYIKVILQNNRMQGALLVGNNDFAEVFEFLIYDQIDLSRFGDNLLDDVLDVEDFFD